MPSALRPASTPSTSGQPTCRSHWGWPRAAITPTRSISPLATRSRRRRIRPASSASCTAPARRSPPGTRWEWWIESKIGVAMEAGAFDNLPGAGKPLPNLDQEYDPLWWVKQLAQREQLSMLPPSLELLRKVEKELATIEKLHDEATVRRRVAALNVEIARVNATVVEGPPTRLGPLDVDQVVARWRRARSATPR